MFKRISLISLSVILTCCTLAPASTTTPTLLPGASRQSEKDGMVQRYVPEGEFLMGAGNGGADEQPVHRIYLEAFWIDQTEVTNRMYAQCVATGKCVPTDCSDLPAFSDEQQPVVCVKWDQASAYCEWAGRRLPTEAEWEKAARGTDGRTYPWGEELDPQKANYGNNVGTTTRGGAYPAGASPYGALDMAGNMWEWVTDWYSGTYYAVSPEHNPTGAASGDTRVMRGGSWGEIGFGIRTTARGRLDPAHGDHHDGFRCAASP